MVRDFGSVVSSEGGVKVVIVPSAGSGRAHHLNFADVSPPSELASGSKGRVRCINKWMLSAVWPLGCEKEAGRFQLQTGRLEKSEVEQRLPDLFGLAAQWVLLGRGLAARVPK